MQTTAESLDEVAPGDKLSLPLDALFLGGAESDTDLALQIFVSPSDDSFSEEELAWGSEYGGWHRHLSRLRSTKPKRLVD